MQRNKLFFPSTILLDPQFRLIPNHSPTGSEFVRKFVIFKNKKACYHTICRLFVGFDTSFGGEWGIRTRGPFDKSTVFKTAAIDHSANSPAQKYKYTLNLQTMG
jgi:hypothetical protein